jgi:hypothetical protein
MSPVQAPEVASATDEVEITAEAVSSYARLLRATGHRIHTYATRDGGLICEDRTRTRARPTMWRIQGDGTLVADTPYNFLVQAFVASGLPAAVS